MQRRMHEMLHAVHRDWRIRSHDIQDALHAQDLVAMAIEQHRQPDAEHGPVERAVECQDKRLHRSMRRLDGCREGAERRMGAVVEQHRGADRLLGRPQQWRVRIEITQLGDQRGTIRREVGLGQDQPVSHGDLLDAFGSTEAIHGVDGGHHVAEAKVVAQHRVGLHRRQDGKWIGQARALDHESPEFRHRAALTP